jgi:hypothetical protein
MRSLVENGLLHFDKGLCVLSDETTDLLRPVRCLVHSCKQVSVFGAGVHVLTLSAIYAPIN